MSTRLSMGVCCLVTLGAGLSVAWAAEGDNPLLGQWESPDGKRILVFTPEAYGTFVDRVLVDKGTYQIRGKQLILRNVNGQTGVSEFTVQGTKLTLSVGNGLQIVFTRSAKPKAPPAQPAGPGEKPVVVPPKAQTPVAAPPRAVPAADATALLGRWQTGDGSAIIVFKGDTYEVIVGGVVRAALIYRVSDDKIVFTNDKEKESAVTFAISGQELTLKAPPDKSTTYTRMPQAPVEAPAPYRAEQPEQAKIDEIKKKLASHNILDHVDMKQELYQAIRSGQRALAEMLLANGASLHRATRKDWGAMHTAVDAGDIEMVKFLLAKGGSVMEPGPYGQTPLFMARTWAMAKFLLDHGANLNAVAEFGETVLYSAAWTGNADMVKAYLDRGLDPNALLPEDTRRETPIFAAARFARTDTVKLLIERGAKTDLVNARGEGLLHVAMEIKPTRALVELLLASGVKVDLVDAAGKTALHDAVAGGLSPDARAVVELLLAKGLKATDQDAQGNTPLHCACEKGRTDLAELLLDKGANGNAANKKGETALSIATRLKNQDLIALLQARGAKAQGDKKP